MDGLFLVEQNGKRYLLHIEFKSRPGAAVSRQVARDACLAHFLVPDELGRFGRLAVRSIVIFASPPRGRRASATGYQMRRPAGWPEGAGRLRYDFEGLMLYDESAAEHLRSDHPGWLPLVPLMAGATETMAREACARILSLPEEQATLRAELAVAFLFLAENCFPETNWPGIITEEVLMQSTTYKSIIEKSRQEGRVEGRQEGRVEGRVEILLGLLQDRVESIPEDLQGALLATTDERQILEVRRTLAQPDTELLPRLRVLFGLP